MNSVEASLVNEILVGERGESGVMKCVQLILVQDQLAKLSPPVLEHLHVNFAVVRRVLDHVVLWLHWNARYYFARFNDAVSFLKLSEEFIGVKLLVHANLAKLIKSSNTAGLYEFLGH